MQAHRRGHLPSVPAEQGSEGRSLPCTEGSALDLRGLAFLGERRPLMKQESLSEYLTIKGGPETTSDSQTTARVVGFIRPRPWGKVKIEDCVCRQNQGASVVGSRWRSEPVLFHKILP